MRDLKVNEMEDCLKLSVCLKRGKVGQLSGALRGDRINIHCSAMF